MDTLLVLGTSAGVIVVQRQEESGQNRKPIGAGLNRGGNDLTNETITSLTVLGEVILAGTRRGVFRSDDRGSIWRESSAGLTIPHVRWLASHPEIPGRVFAATEPAGIFLSPDYGETWHSCPEVEGMRREYGWALPYSPEAGCVRGLAFHERRGYAAVEDGCVLVSVDAGETWQLAAGSRGRPDHFPQPTHIHSDVHSIEVHPHNPDWVAAPTGGGFFMSFDSGQTWQNCYPRCYARAVWWDPVDPDHLILGPADGVDRAGRIEETHDGGRTWRTASGGLEVSWLTHMVERFTQVEDRLYAVLSNGQLLTTSFPLLEWNTIFNEIGHVNAVASL